MAACVFLELFQSYGSIPTWPRVFQIDFCLFLCAGSADTSTCEEKKRKPAVGSSGMLGEKRTKMGGSSLLTGSTLTGGLSLTSKLSQSLLTSSSLLTTSRLSSHSAGLSLKLLESPLSKLQVGESGPLLMSHTSSGLLLSTAPKPVQLGPVHDQQEVKTVTRSSHSGKPEQAKKTHHAGDTDHGRSKLGKSKKKKMKLEGRNISSGARTHESYAMSPPDYSFRTDEAADEPMELVSFIPPEKDLELMEALTPALQDITGLKVMLFCFLSF